MAHDPQDLLITDVRIFTGLSTIESGYIHVSNGKISSVGALPAPTLPSSTHVLSKPGHTVLPGLLDAHIHADKGNPVALSQSLLFGVTTVLDMHNEPVNVKKLKELAASDESTYADFKSAGVGATIKDGWPEPVVTAHDKSPETLAEVASWPKLTDDDAQISAYIKQNIADGADYTKLMHESGTSMGVEFNHPTGEFQKKVISASHAAGLVAVAHATCLADHLTVLNAGVDGLTHTFIDQPPTDELVEAYRRNNAWLNPTLAAMGSLTTEGKDTQKRFAEKEISKRWISEQGRENLCKCMGFRGPQAKVEYAYESVRVLKKAGIDIVCGSDAAGPALGTAWGISLHHELFLLVTKCGFTPEEALASATSVTAKRFGFGDRGVIEPGRRADLLLVEDKDGRSVLEDVKGTLEIKGVWREGRGCGGYSL